MFKIKEVGNLRKLQIFFIDISTQKTSLFIQNEINVRKENKRYKLSDSIEDMGKEWYLIIKKQLINTHIYFKEISILRRPSSHP